MLPPFARPFQISRRFERPRAAGATFESRETVFLYIPSRDDFSFFIFFPFLLEKRPTTLNDTVPTTSIDYLEKSFTNFSRFLSSLSVLVHDDGNETMIIRPE